MSGEIELKFTSELWKKLREYLEKFRVGGHKFRVEPFGSIKYDDKTPDIVIIDEIGVPQLIIETKRKSDGRQEYLYDPFGRAPIAQALCYAYLALEHHNMDRTPLFAVANRDVIVIFKGIEKEKLNELINICSCRESMNRLRIGLKPLNLEHIVNCSMSTS